MKISFEDIAKVFSHDLGGQSCLEIDFAVEGYAAYQNACMGKMPDAEDPATDVYWFGLTPDGTQGYDYSSFADMSAASVFAGRSLQDIWHLVDITAINSCPPEEQIGVYLKP